MKDGGFLLSGCLFLLTLAPLHGATIFSQLPGGGFTSSSTLNFLGGSPGWETHTAFTLAAGAPVTDLRWWGIQVSGGMDFRVAFYAGGATPGALLAEYNVTPTVQSLPLSAGYDGFVYTAMLSSPFNATGGTQYWMSIFNQAPNTNWAWFGNSQGTTMLRHPGTDVYNVRFYGVAFELNSNPVPEPSTGVLLGLGMMLVAGRQWSRRRRD
jgi:hypothetical protein